MIAAVLIQLLLGTATLGLGLAGLKPGRFAAPAWMDPTEQQLRNAARRRGALLCVGIGSLFLVAAVAVLIARLVR